MLNWGLSLATLLGAGLPVLMILNRNISWGRKLFTAGIFIWGVWWGAAWFLVGYVVRNIWAGILALTMLYAISNRKSQSPVRLTFFKKVGWNFLVIIGLLFFMGLLLGRWYPPNPAAINVQMPLRNGIYAISQGGSNGATNPVHHGEIQSERLAIDWVKLNGWGSRASGISPGNLSQYEIFGDTVFAPIAGRVISVIDSLPNCEPGHPDTLHPLGNFIRISFDDSLNLVLAHLQPNFNSVISGDSVHIGDRLGLVGNSGDSREPHLQMSVSNTRGWAVPILMGDIYPVLNDRFVHHP